MPHTPYQCAPTGLHVKFPIVVIVRFTNETPGHELKIVHEHIYWDQATVLKQVGALPASLVDHLDISGSEQAAKVIDPSSVPSNEFLRRTGRYFIDKNSHECTK